MFHDLMRCCKCLHDRLRSELEPHGVFRGQGRILHFLTHHGAVSQVEIARHLMLRRATVTRMLQRMERDGLVERFRDSSDERVIRVRLTEAGHRAESVMMEVRDGIEAAIGAALTPEECRRFRTLLARVTEALCSGDGSVAGSSGWCGGARHE